MSGSINMSIRTNAKEAIFTAICVARRRLRYRYGSCEHGCQIKGRVCIDERPSMVNERSRIGDWEADTVIGKPGGAVLVTLAIAKSRLSIIALASNKTALDRLRKPCCDRLKSVASQVHTLTYDNGKEFAYHGEIAEELKARGGIDAHPYHSWERGLNENTNGLIRQYLPKGTNFQSLTHQDVQNIMDKLNNRPKKCLAYKTPNQVFFGINPPVALAS